MVGHSLGNDPALQARALELWNKNRTGPYVESAPTDHINWLRLPDSSSIIEKFGDLSSGRESAHIEIVLGMLNDTYDTIVFLVSPASRGSLAIGSNNPFDNPLIDPGYYTFEFDLLTIQEGIKSAVYFSKALVWENVITGMVGPLANATTALKLTPPPRTTQ
ncbi:hypothetical protein P691DRAFT_762158 [Macrolepiota fuliginosa MF-IS2]|uniref:Uncharacterized protein n=1 Tax=Macrolepiota fuliginosa MF-IS2 TaxID=1400762 RepID=A0A9P5X753_9AGAR|nr:hypothetical protein P691DRAFT_762158 [Macrolepiota fuliginosa MF-IS2]